jgi:hypothetical protein
MKVEVAAFIACLVTTPAVAFLPHSSRRRVASRTSVVRRLRVLGGIEPQTTAIDTVITASPLHADPGRAAEENVAYFARG